MNSSRGRVLVTGGAGFIGSHTVDILIDRGYDVTLLDSLEPPTHSTRDFPNYLSSNCIKIKGSILSRDVLEEICKDAEAVIHLASLVGGYQSLYQIDRYVEANTRGTANLLDVLVNSEHSVRKMVLGSSMMVYGEGTYHCKKCNTVQYPSTREQSALEQRRWEHSCPSCNSILTPIPTDENKPTNPGSIYAASKKHQEEMSLLISKTYGIPISVLRYFNVYGSRQSLSNPYTGVCAVFTSRILNDKPPVIFEDGKMLRDFVHVKDVARANVMALESPNANNEIINIGSGAPTSTADLANTLIKIYKSNVQPEVSYKYRTNDIRQCYADISKAKKALGYVSQVDLETGLRELAVWATANRWGAIDLFENSLEELSKKRLLF